MAAAMTKHVLVTGANKGVGAGIVRRLLLESEDVHAIIGSRDESRGQKALEALVTETPAWAQRLSTLTIDVADAESVKSAATRLPSPLYAIVNNAGIAEGTLRSILQVNVHGIRNVWQALAPLVAPGGTIVNVTSAAGPSYIAKAPEHVRAVLTDPGVTWEQIEAIMSEALAAGGDECVSLGEGDAYGLSKACANALTRIMARERPDLRVNAVTPGFIETDLTRSYSASRGVSAAELGMKTPHDGAFAPVRLVLDETYGSGRYYGSDCKRSPLDKYRGPGEPEYSE